MSNAKHQEGLATPLKLPLAFYQYKRIKSHYAQRNRPSPHPSPQRGEGRVRGPHVKEMNAFVLVKRYLLIAKSTESLFVIRQDE